MRSTKILLLSFIFLFFACFHQANRESSKVELNDIEKINKLLQTLHARGYTETSPMGGGKDTNWRPFSLEPSSFHKDTVLRAFYGVEKRIETVRSSGFKDTVSCLRLYIEYDSSLSEVPYDFKVSTVSRNFDDNILRQSLGKDYTYWPKPVQPKIKWGAAVFEHRCINVTLHVFPVVNVTDLQMHEIINSTLSFIINNAFADEEMAEILKRLEMVTKK